jgi:hypothetical protein
VAAGSLNDRATHFVNVLSRAGFAPEPVAIGVWQGPCRVHRGSLDALQVTLASDGTCVATCRAGCSASAIASVIGLTLGDLFPRQWVNRPAATEGGAR